MKNKKTKEMRVYELLGVKHFRIMAFGIAFLLCKITSPAESMKEIKQDIYGSSTNYTIGKKINYERIKKFKWRLLFNASVHALLNVLLLLGVFPGVSLLGMISVFTINSYCVMLQRYNQIRINQILENYKSHYEKQKQKASQELIEEDSKMPEHEYAVMHSRGKLYSITLDEIINNASLEELRHYKMMLQLALIHSKPSSVFTITNRGKRLRLVRR